MVASIKSLVLLGLGSLSAALSLPPEYAITASPDGHHFQDSTGAPFFWQGDTAWLLFHRLTLDEAEVYLADRAAKGYNMVLAVGFTQIGIASPNRQGDLTFIDEDPTKPNEAYWKHIDAIVEMAWDKGIRVALVPAWGYYTHGSDDKGSVLDEKTSRPFGEFIGKRYPYLPKLLVGDTNPWWMNKGAVKNDYAAGGVPPEYHFTDWRPLYDELAEGIVSGERAATGDSSWDPLMTIHCTNQWFTGGPIALASAQMGEDRSWLTFDASQSGHVDTPPNPPIPWWNARRGWETAELMYAVGETAPGKKRPALDNEPHYENRYNGKMAPQYWNASDIRAGSWQTAFSGGAGVTYGSDNVMQMYIPGLFDPANSGPVASWEEDIHLPGAGQVQYITQAIMDRGNRTFFSRVPAQDIVMGNAGVNDKRVTATRDSKGSWIMVYTPTGEPFSIDVKGLRVCKSLKASWLDPLSGKYTAFDFAKPTGNTTAQFTPPKSSDHADWVLVLESK